MSIGSSNGGRFLPGVTLAKSKSIVAAEHKIEEFTEDLGRMLGHARTKAEGWLSQRQSIVKSLAQLRDEASTLLSQLGHEAGEVVRVQGARATESKSAKKTTPAKKRRTMSAKARAAISAAQKARWAKKKAGAKK
jgi:hypothetical protein